MGTWIKVERNREQSTIDLHMGIPFETVTLTSFGRNKQLYFNILEEGKAMFFHVCLDLNPLELLRILSGYLKNVIY